jgi:hypothetical protein
MKFLFFLFLPIVIVIGFLSCTEEGINKPSGNQPPDTGLFLYPDSTISQQPSRLSVHWWGDDPDGVITGFYFMWEGIDSIWNFVKGNDSTFALPIGSSDTTYRFIVAAVDDGSNNLYDNQVIRNGIDYGPEPYDDLNGNGSYNTGETFYDIGLVDPSPAVLTFPIRNTPPVLTWDDLTVIPDTSFPVMTFKWIANDLDGDESIKFLNIGLNDTLNFLSLSGSVKLITLRIADLDDPDPKMEILINGSDQNIFSEELPGLKLDDNNTIYIQAEDLSGATSRIISLPDTNSTWFVKKPKGKLLIFDDFTLGSANEIARVFYNDLFSTISGGALNNKFDVFDLDKQSLPFENVTLPETMKLFEYTYWYSNSAPRLDLANIITNKYLQNGGKIAFSMTFEESSGYLFDLSLLQGFLPVDSVSNYIDYLYSGADILPVSLQSGYPALKTTATITFARTFTPNTLITTEIYNLQSSQGTGNIGFINNDKTVFFIGLPLHQCNGGDQNVDSLLEKVFIDEFGLVP